MGKALLVTIFAIYSVFIYLSMRSNLCCAFAVWILFFTASILCYLYERKFAKMFSKFVSSQELVQIRGMFVNIASHELRNPMTTIYSSID
ncbi:MAG: hypothetical protein LBJ13_03200, partial [Puniceicoccales bacterium]|nr:hypothetical protein [Puniceicoccales bacterium]